MKYIYYLLVLLVISNAALGQQTKNEEELAKKRYEKTIKRDYKYQFLTTNRIVEGNVIATEYYVYNYMTYLVKYFLIAKQIKGVFWTNDGLIEVISPCDEIHWSDVKKGVINWETDYSHNKSTREMLLLGYDSITQYAPYTLKWSNDRGYNPREFSIKSYIKDEDSQTWKDPSGERDIPADEKKFYRLIEKYGL